MEQEAIATNTVTEKFTTWLMWAREKVNIYEAHTLSLVAEQ
jgi:hypothetical protein